MPGGQAARVQAARCQGGRVAGWQGGRVADDARPLHTMAGRANRAARKIDMSETLKRIYVSLYIPKQSINWVQMMIMIRYCVRTDSKKLAPIRRQPATARKAMKKIKSYKGFVIANENDIFLLFTNEEWAYGAGYRNPEWEASSIEEAINFIDSY